jgi:hypothetical protein
VGIETDETLHPCIHPQSPAHGVEDAGLDGARGVGRIGAKAEAVATVLVALIFEEVRIGQQRQNPADALFVVFILLAMLFLFGGRGDEAVEARLLLLLGFWTERSSVAEGESGDGAFGGLHLIFKLGLLLEAALNPVVPVAVPFVVAEFVVDDLADQFAGRDWLRELLGMDAKCALGHRQKPRS